MNRSVRHIVFVVLAALIAVNVRAQTEPMKFEYSDGKVVATIERVPDTVLLNELLDRIGSSLSITDSLARTSGMGRTPLGWQLISADATRIVYAKNLEMLSWSDRKPTYIFTVPEAEKPPYSLEATYGINKMKREGSDFRQENEVPFRLYGSEAAETVYLSGTFNDWSTGSTPMIYRNDSWQRNMLLPPGKYLYKFIVDGRWKIDPNNEVRENDNHGHTNSVLFVCNHTFTLDIYLNAKSVYVAGSFNGWNRKELKLEKNNGRWELPIFLADGSYSYKFVVDGHWVLDPQNPEVREDGSGNKNSFLSIGDPVRLTVDAFDNAARVVCAGEFNGWNEGELSMRREQGVWSTSWVLAPGNYAYKLIVDGEWHTDPGNPHYIGRGDYRNSVLTVNPNHVFRLDGYQGAKEVIVTGEFNGWSEDGYTMKKTAAGWEMPIHLDKGKTVYKFIVDGEWIIDPANPLWEANAFDTRNSVLWLE